MPDEPSSQSIPTKTATPDLPSQESVSDVFKKLGDHYPIHPFSEINGTDPYRILISCILTLRTQDQVSLPATERLFARASTPETMLALSTDEVSNLIYPVGFYRNKAQVIEGINQQLMKDHNGKVPGSLKELLAFKGVGRKTANLVLSLGFQIPAICVDIHVHRIANRLGWVCSESPDETEFQLMSWLPAKYWIPINQYFVLHGQQLCRPTAPKCSSCFLRNHCLTGQQAADL